MNRREEPPERDYPEPDWYCNSCGRHVLGHTCSKCERTEEESHDAFEAEQERRVQEFTEMLEEEDAFNFTERQLWEIKPNGKGIMVKPRFRVGISTVLQLPGVNDVTIDPRSKDTRLLIDYDGPSDREDQLHDESLSHYIEKVQVLANRHGPSRAARMVNLSLNDPDRLDEAYDPDSTESLAIRAVARYWKYQR